MTICIGAKIKELRKRDSMTQEQLAEKLNVTPQTISRWETETAYPDITAIPILANIFDVSIDTLMGYDKTKTAQKVNDIITSSKKYFWNNIREIKIRTGHTVLANQAQGAKEKSNSISTCPNLVAGVIKITQRCFTAIFELNK